MSGRLAAFDSGTKGERDFTRCRAICGVANGRWSFVSASEPLSLIRCRLKTVIIL